MKARSARVVAMVAVSWLLQLTGPGASPVQADDPQSVFFSFNGDGAADLAIGVTNEDLGGDNATGAVNVLYGRRAGGLSATDNQFWHQSVIGVLDSADPWDHFGYALALGDFDGDTYLDLAVGIPYEDVWASINSGAVHVLYGTASGLSTAGD